MMCATGGALPSVTRVIQPVEKFFVNPPVRLAWRLEFGPPGKALLETIGRRTGRTRRTPICNGQEGNTFWFVVQHGGRTDYVRNIEANPHVRVRTGSRAAWRTGMAYVLDDDDDDANKRVRLLEQSDPWRQLCQGASKAMRWGLGLSRCSDRHAGQSKRLWARTTQSLRLAAH